MATKKVLRLVGPRTQVKPSGNCQPVVLLDVIVLEFFLWTCFNTSINSI